MKPIERIAQEYGPQLVADVRTIIQDETATLKRQIAEGDLQVRRQRVISALDSDRHLGGVWRQVNNEQPFLDWLAQPDPLYGFPRMQGLQRAFNAGEPGPVRALFSAFLVEHKRLDPSAAPRTASPASSASQSQRAGNNQKRTYTRAEVARFYEDCRNGAYDKDPERRRQMELAILEAAREGRVERPLDPDAIAITQPRPPLKPRFKYRGPGVAA